MFGAIFEVYEIRCKSEFQISVRGYPLKSEKVARLARFEVYEIRWRVCFGL